MIPVILLRHEDLPASMCATATGGMRAAIARINSFTQEHVSGMSVVQLFNREQRALRRLRDGQRQHKEAFKDAIFAYALYYPVGRVAELDRDCAGDLAWRRRCERRLRTDGPASSDGVVAC